MISRAFVRLLRATPIKQKLMGVTVVTTLLALGLAGGGLALYDQHILRRGLVAEMTGTARLIGFSAAWALAADDAMAVDETLQTLVAQEHIAAACIYRGDGGIFARYVRDQRERVDFPARSPAKEFVFAGNQLRLAAPVRFSGKPVGTVFLVGDATELERRLTHSAIAFGIVLLVAGAVAYFVALRLHRVVLQPIAQLATITTRVAARNDYSVRALKHADDEVGAFIDAFNVMLTQIQSRDAALQQARAELEKRVEERTRDLLVEEAERRQTTEERDGFFTLATDLMCIAGRDGLMRRANPAFLTVLGYPPQELTQAGFMDLVHPADKALTAWRVKRVTAGAPVREFENRVRHRDGSHRWISWSVTPAPGREYFYACGRDITALKNAQEQATREHARLKFIVNSLPVGICLDHRTADGECSRFLNDAHLRICGLSREEAEVMGAFHRRTHPDDLPQQQALRQQLEDGLLDRFSLEKRYVKPDGQIVWVSYSLQRQRGSDGSAQDLSTVVDITELKRAQEEVALERARFKFIFESVPVGIALMLPDDTEARLVNPAHSRITGIPGTQIADVGVFKRATHPEDYERQRPLVAAFKRGDIDRFTLEKRYLHPDGRVVWVALKRRMFVDESTGLKQAITTIVDITELKTAHEQIARERARFKFIFDTVPIGISWFVPGEETARLVNPAHERITGRSAEAAALDSPPDDDGEQKLVQQFLRGETDHYTLEKRYHHPDGRVVWAVLSSRMFLDPASGTRQSVTTLVDITERKEAEARLAETHRQLLQSSRAAGMAEVATGVLHNVGNVLNSVNVSASLLRGLVRDSHTAKVARLSELLAAQPDLAAFFAHDPRAAKVPAFVRTLAEQLEREQRDCLAELDSLRKNIDHIEEIVAMQQNYAKVSGVRERIAVVDLVEDALRMNAGALVRHDVTVVRDYQANPTVFVEKHKVLQILVNLMRNAKYACEEAGRSEKRMIVRVVEERGRWKIAVVDNGVGIPAENLTRIFSHGFTTRTNGHGFGLHSGALAARELGGSLVAESAGPGLGATFILDLPLACEAKAA